MPNSTNDSIAEAVIAIIAQQAVLPVEDVTPASTPDDLGIDSLGLVESIFAIEEAFDIKVPFDANDPAQNKFDTSSVASIIRAVQGLVADRKT